MSPSKRKNEADKWMPPRVYKGRSAYEYHPPGGGNIRLCALTASKADVWVEYEKHFKADTKQGTVAFLITGYTSDKNFIALAPQTQKDYLDCKEKINDVFGKMRAVDVQPKHVRQYMDLRGQESESRANRERTFLMNVMSWGYERGHVTINPCKGVKPFKLKPRDRYVTDKEYQAIYDIASPNVQAAMEIAYLCAARQGDILKLTKADIQDEGLYIHQGKTGKKQIKRWTTRLRAAVNLALKQPSEIETIYIIHNRKGTPYTSSGFKSNWKRWKTVAGVDCTFHDLKAKGISDYEGDKQYFSGHTSKSMMEKYNRSADIVDIVDPQKSNN